jgi:hypothetical protein
VTPGPLPCDDCRSPFAELFPGGAWLCRRCAALWNFRTLPPPRLANHDPATAPVVTLSSETLDRIDRARNALAARNDPRPALELLGEFARFGFGVPEAGDTVGSAGTLPGPAAADVPASGTSEPGSAGAIVGAPRPPEWFMVGGVPDPREIARRAALLGPWARCVVVVELPPRPDDKASDRLARLEAGFQVGFVRRLWLGASFTIDTGGDASFYGRIVAVEVEGVARYGEIGLLPNWGKLGERL